MKVRIGVNDFESNYPDLVKKYWGFYKKTGFSSLIIVIW